MNFHFDTRPEWIEAIRGWAVADRRVAGVWVFGSRARGSRTPKPDAAPIPDLDIGYTLTGQDGGERLAYAMFEVGRARTRLQAQIPVPLDLQYADPGEDERVWPAILDHGVLIYESADD